MASSADSPGKSVRAVLDAWREQHADRLDPVRFHFIEALEARASDQEGEVRRILDERLSHLLEIYAGGIEDNSTKRKENLGSAKQPHKTAHGALGGLLQHIGSHKATVKMDGAAAADATASEPENPSPSFPAELPALLEFRKIWSKVRTDGQLKQSLEQVPTNAGPLNSGVLVHRSIMLMHELSPGYLQHLLSYVDTLSWMEQMQGEGRLVADTARVAGGNKQARNKSRKRRD